MKDSVSKLAGLLGSPDPNQSMQFSGMLYWKVTTPKLSRSILGTSALWVCRRRTTTPVTPRTSCGLTSVLQLRWCFNARTKKKRWSGIARFRKRRRGIEMGCDHCARARCIAPWCQALLRDGKVVVRYDWLKMKWSPVLRKQI